MSVLGTILKTVDIDLDLDDVLDIIAKRNPTLAFIIASIIGLGGVAIVVMFFIGYIQ